MERDLITFKNINNDIFDHIYVNGYLCSEEQYLRNDHYLSFLAFLCSRVKKGWFLKEEISPLMNQFLKYNK